MLDKQVKSLYSQGEFREAMTLAERSLSLREKALGATHPDIAASLNNIAVLYLTQGVYARAEPLLVRAVDISEKARGAMHPAVATSLNSLASLYHMQGAYARAEPLLVRALDIVEKARGAMHPHVAASLNNLATLYKDQGAYARAEPLLVRSLDIVEKALGAMHPHVAANLNNLAGLYQHRGEYARAEPLLVRALDIFEKVLGAMHPDVAASLNNLASLYQAQGAYARAEPLLVRALDIREKAFGAMHPDVATGLNYLASLYQAQGAYARAEPLMVRALDIREKALGALHPDVAASLNNLALLYRDQGAYARAEPLMVRALDIHEKALGAMHADVATSLNNLALLYRDQGAYARAEPLLVRALDISEQALGAMHPDVARSLNNLASLYLDQGSYARAEPLYVRALNISEKALGATHPRVATSLNNLARLYRDQGGYTRAEPLMVRALEIREKALGAMHPSVATSLNNLAMLYKAQGAYARAEPLLARALDIHEKALSATHPHFAASLNNLAGLYRMQGAYARAEPLLVRAAAIQESHLRIELVRLSESRKRDLLSLLEKDTAALVSFHAHELPASSRALETAFTAILRRKGRVLDALVETQASLRAHLTPQLRDKLAKLADATTQLSTRLHAPFNLKTARNQQDEIKGLRAQIDTLEGELNAASGPFRVRSEPVTLAKLQAALPSGAALVELVRYRRYDARRPQPLQEARYLAYLLLRQGPPRWVSLGEAAPIEAAVDDVLATMRKDASAEAARRALRKLDAKLLAPIRSRLPGVSHLIIAPDGKLNLVPFEALIDPRGRPALEQYLISYLTSGRDLLRLAVKQAPQSPATIVADPDYGPGKYVRLGGTVAEAQAIARHLPGVQTLSGDRATKAALSRLAGPAVLHVATHGFYNRAGGSAPAAPPTTTVAQQSPAATERGMSIEGALAAPPPGSSKDDPTEALDHAGLALAGANVRPDGIVSARELAGWDWWGTQLVVLSACETGVGAVPSGEGVYGLRRALVLAGAQSQVVSLWNVNDSSAPELMRDLYGELARGTGRAEALRRAKLRMLRQPRFAHPYYWTAFIPAGDWAPLPAGTMRPQEGRGCAR